jgi:6-phosphogluconate dehydrogenase
MLHNGIEYAEMQIITEAYHILKRANYTNIEISKFFKELSTQNRSSYLIEITSEILLKKNDSGYLLDQIQSNANHKGTGKLTVETSLNYGFPLPSVFEAFNARVESNYDNLWSKNIDGQLIDISSECLNNAIYFARLATMIQGLLFIQNVSNKEQLDIDLKEVLQNWSAGCIIRSDLLNELGSAKLLNPITTTSSIQDLLQNNLSDAKEVIKSCIDSGISIPVIVSSYNWFVGTSSKFNPSALIQSQRDYFGAHQVQFKNSDEFIHLDWD